MIPLAVGIDFGTTNSTVAMVDAQGRVESLTWPSVEGPTDIFRTALTFWSEGRLPRATLRHVAGPQALERALAPDGHHRFVQSIKTYLATKSFSETRLYGQRFSIEQLVSTFLKHLTDGAHDQLFAPGAAYWYARDLQRDETVLVADFGGGTSDFSVIRFTRDASGRIDGEALAHAGVGVAGDTFDYRLVDHLVSPAWQGKPLQVLRQAVAVSGLCACRLRAMAPAFLA